MSNLLSTVLPATAAAPRQLLCVTFVGLFGCSFRLAVAGRLLAVAALLAAAHNPGTARAAEQLASLKVTVIRPAQPWSSAPRVRETYDTYNVHGTSIPELREGLRRNGVRMNDGDIYDALTSWDVRWEYDYDRTAGDCSVGDFRIFVDVTIRYPRWVSDNNTPGPLADSWEAYLHSLILHEQGHRDIAVAAADSLSRAVAALRPAATCADLDQAVNALGRSYMKQLSQDQQAYDAETCHGTMQGAVFP